MRKKIYWTVIIISMAILALCACDNTQIVTSPSTNIDVNASTGQGGSTQKDITLASPVQGDSPGEILVAMHYVNWHAFRNGKTSFGDATVFPQFSPEGYDSQDPRVIKMHVDQLSQNGILPLVSWWGGRPGVSDYVYSKGDGFLKAFLAVESRPQIGILYESVSGKDDNGLLMPDGNGTTYTFGPENTERFVADINHLDKEFFSNPKYAHRFYRINGKPLVYLWASAGFRGPFYQASKAVRDKAFFLGSEFSLYAPGRPDLLDTVRGLDAISAYTICDEKIMAPSAGHIDAPVVAEYMRAVSQWSQWLKDNEPSIGGVRLVLPVSFAFDNGKVHPPMVSTEDEFRAFANAVRSLIDQSRKDGTNIMPMINATSWNEHYEGFSFEPTVEYGSWPLTVLRDVFYPNKR